MKPPPSHAHRLVEAEQAVALGRDHIARQWQIILEKDQRGADTALSRQLLRTFYEVQTLHEEQLDRLLDEVMRQYP